MKNRGFLWTKLLVKLIMLNSILVLFIYSLLPSFRIIQSILLGEGWSREGRRFVMSSSRAGFLQTMNFDDTIELTLIIWGIVNQHILIVTSVSTWTTTKIDLPNLLHFPHCAWWLLFVLGNTLHLDVMFLHHSIMTSQSTFREYPG